MAATDHTRLRTARVGARENTVREGARYQRATLRLSLDGTFLPPVKGLRSMVIGGEP